MLGEAEGRTGLGWRVGVKRVPQRKGLAHIPPSSKAFPVGIRGGEEGVAAGRGMSPRRLFGKGNPGNVVGKSGGGGEGTQPEPL